MKLLGAVGWQSEFAFDEFDDRGSRTWEINIVVQLDLDLTPLGIVRVVGAFRNGARPGFDECNKTTRNMQLGPAGTLN
ncbi:hypothetical protein PHLCEN_2v11982 [Hermanssonia centrifuga]|uniref:Uncharacterized protein n=1 Tax=Hermanssonia centrifuga TaxID=98765 RepID=A0A2R6NIC0_9APHY|nr:hypothetical protein PHLCEN_2v11982 [Hermanssonia centrifuga]